METPPMEEIKKLEEAKLTSAAAFVEGGIQEACDDACSICLEEFCESDPSTVTGCKHEFHLQCILEWHGRMESTLKSEGPVHPFHPKMTIRRGILEAECGELMQQSFKLRRNKDKKTEQRDEKRYNRKMHNPSKLLHKMHHKLHILFHL